jgi:Tol biopolymer transport system component
VFSPDGKQVLFLRDPGCAADYWRVEAATGFATQVSAEAFCDFDASVLGHDWSPDGKDIVLVGRDAQGHTLIYRVPAGMTAVDYAKDRVLIGRGVDLGGFVTDMQPSWRP